MENEVNHDLEAIKNDDFTSDSSIPWFLTKKKSIIIHPFSIIEMQGSTQRRGIVFSSVYIYKSYFYKVKVDVQKDH